MANPIAAFGSYLADSLKVFLLPVSTIRNAAERQLSFGSAFVVLVLLAVVAGGIQLILSQMPGGLGEPASLGDVVSQTIAYIVFFTIALGLLFGLIVSFGGKTQFTRLFAAKLSLASTVVGAFIIGLLGKLLIGLLFLGAQDGVAGGVIVLGEQFGMMAIGLIVAFYTIIVARFGGEVSWPIAIVVTVVHFLLMLAIATAYGVILPDSNLFGIQPALQI
jgi:hypothetical protein